MTVFLRRMAAWMDCFRLTLEYQVLAPRTPSVDPQACYDLPGAIYRCPVGILRAKERPNKTGFFSSGGRFRGAAQQHEPTENTDDVAEWTHAALC